MATEPQPLPREQGEARFTRLYAEHGRDILAYALRRAASPEDAADVVAETFLVAWRRAGEVPAGEEARLWLFGVARLTLANEQRRHQRRAQLGELMRAELATQLGAEAAPETDSAVAAALERLDERDREVLTLAGWDELEPAEIATVLGLSPVAVRSRLHRARRRLRSALAENEAGMRSGACRDNELELEEAR